MSDCKKCIGYFVPFAIMLSAVVAFSTLVICNAIGHLTKEVRDSAVSITVPPSKVIVVNKEPEQVLPTPKKGGCKR